MSYFYSIITKMELKLIIAALESLLKNLNRFANMDDYIYLSRNVPSVIKKLKTKNEIDGGDLALIAISLVYIQKVMENTIDIPNTDKDKIALHSSVYQKLFKQFGWIAPVE